MEAHALAVEKDDLVYAAFPQLGKHPLKPPGAGTHDALAHPSGAQLCGAQITVTVEPDRSDLAQHDKYCVLCVSVVLAWWRQGGADISAYSVSWFEPDGRQVAPPDEVANGPSRHYDRAREQSWPGARVEDPNSPAAVRRRVLAAEFAENQRRLHS